jgi:hypothetical protein
MALVLKDRVQETTTTTGTGTLTLAGAVTGYQSFSAIGNANTTYYAIYASGGSQWEVGIGTYTASGTTLSRDTVLSSSTGSLVSFSAGTKNVWCDYPAGRAGYVDTNSTLNAPVLATSGTTSTTPVLGFNASNTNLALGAAISGSYLQAVMQNTSATAGASTNFAVSNNLGTDSSYYGEFGMNSSVFSATTPVDFFSINNGIYFSGHDGDVTVGSGNGYKTYFAWGTTGQSAHVINVTGAIGLNTNLGTTPAGSGTTNFGTSGQVLTSAGSAATPTWTTPTTGTVTSVTGTSPVVSSGGNTPAISMPAATTSVDGYLKATDWTTFNNKGSGTVTSVAAITLGTTGTDLSSTVATGTTTPVITLQVPTASATNRGALSAADWTTFNGKGSGTVTSVGGTGTVNGLTLTGTVTTSGNLTLGGTLSLASPPAIGGTTPAAITGTTITATKYVGVSGGTF